MEHMSNIKKFVVEHKRLIFIFVFCLLVYEFSAYSIHFADPEAMYAFSHAIKMGEVPYRDFNIISTPLYAFIMTPGLFIFDNYLTFIIEQSILVTILFWFLFKSFDKKAWFALFALTMTAFMGINPTYNFMCFFFIAVLWHLEKECSDKDLLIGVVIGLAILSKHTVGLPLILPMFIICFKDIKKLGKRILGICIPCFIFLIYLLINHALYDFINLSFLGLFDFRASNAILNYRLIIYSIIIGIIMIIIIFKNHKDKYNYYLLCGLLFVYPIFDMNHFGILFNCCAILIINYIKVKEINYFSKLSIVVTIIYSIVFFMIFIFSYPTVFYKGINHYQYTLGFKSDYIQNKKANKLIDNYVEKANKDNKKYILLSGYSMFYNLTQDNKITYYDVLFYGNLGYNGTERMIKEIDSMKNTYVIVDMNSYIYKDDTQINKKIYKHVVNNYEMIDEKDVLRLYYKP